MNGSTKSNSQQQSTSSNTIDPNELAMLQNNYAGAQGRAASLTPYTGQMVAGFNPAQTQAQGVLSGIGTNPLYGQNANSAVNAVQGVLNNPVSAQPYNAAQLSNTDLSPYLNPYTNDVINSSIAQNERARQMAQVGDSQQATAQGAFGGSRSGIMGALTNQYYDQNDQANIANLNSSNYAQAQNAAQNDIGAQNAAKQFNSTQGVNTAFQNQANQFAGANQLADLNNNALGVATNQAGLLSAVGDTQQQQQQAELTAAYNAWTQGQQLTIDQQNLLNAALGMIPIQQTVNSSGTSSGTTSTNPGLAGYLTAIGSVARGAGSIMGGG